MFYDLPSPNPQQLITDFPPEDLTRLIELAHDLGMKHSESTLKGKYQKFFEPNLVKACDELFHETVQSDESSVDSFNTAPLIPHIEILGTEFKLINPNNPIEFAHTQLLSLGLPSQPVPIYWEGHPAELSNFEAKLDQTSKKVFVSSVLKINHKIEGITSKTTLGINIYEERLIQNFEHAAIEFSNANYEGPISEKRNTENNQLLGFIPTGWGNLHIKDTPIKILGKFFPKGQLIIERISPYKNQVHSLTTNWKDWCNKTKSVPLTGTIKIYKSRFIAEGDFIATRTNGLNLIPVSAEIKLPFLDHSFGWIDTELSTNQTEIEILRLRETRDTYQFTRVVTSLSKVPHAILKIGDEAKDCIELTADITQAHFPDDWQTQLVKMLIPSQEIAFPINQAFIKTLNSSAGGIHAIRVVKTAFDLNFLGMSYPIANLEQNHDILVCATQWLNRNTCRVELASTKDLSSNTICKGFLNYVTLEKVNAEGKITPGAIIDSQIDVEKKHDIKDAFASINIDNAVHIHLGEGIEYTAQYNPKKAIRAPKSQKTGKKNRSKQIQKSNEKWVPMFGKVNVELKKDSLSSTDSLSDEVLGTTIIASPNAQLSGFQPDLQLTGPNAWRRMTTSIRTAYLIGEYNFRMQHFAQGLGVKVVKALGISNENY